MERNYIKEMVCLEAYTALKDGAQRALSMLHEGKIKEAEEQLRCCLLHGEIIMDKNCEEYFCINQKCFFGKYSLIFSLQKTGKSAIL